MVKREPDELIHPALLFCLYRLEQFSINCYTMYSDIYLSENVLQEKTKTALIRTDDRPDTKFIRGTCPECGEPLVSNCLYTDGKGYLIVWECWGMLKDKQSCSYKRIL